MKAPVTHGFDHVGLTVRDLVASKEFFERVLGWKQYGENSTYPSVFMTDGVSKLTLWEKKAAEFSDFDRHRNIGLHHLAIRVSNAEDLRAVFDRVRSWPGVEIEFGPELSGQGPKEHFMFYEPGGTRLEISFDPR